MLLIARHEKIVHFRAIGYADASTRRRMERDSIFRLHSMTKPIAATALMMLYEEGKFQLDDPVSKYIPELKGLRVLRKPDSSIEDTVPALREPTIHDLLRFTDGFSSGLIATQSAVDAAYFQADVRGQDVSLEEMMRRLGNMPLLYQPGKTVGYGIASDIQARLVEVLSNMPFDVFLRQRLFEPLKMADTDYGVRANAALRLVSVHWSKNGRVVPMGERYGYPTPKNILYEPRQVNSYLHRNVRVGGAGGLVGTAEDYWRFAQMIANGGVFAGRRFLSPSTVSFMAQDHRTFLFEPTSIENSSGWGWGLGFAVMNNPAKAGFMGSAGSLFWHGAAATTFWIDPEKDLVVVALTQHLGSEKSDLGELIPEVRNLVYSALID